MSSSNYCFMTCIHVSQKTDKVVWDSHLFKTFPKVVVIHTVNAFSVVSEAEEDIFLEFPCFLPPSHVELLHTRPTALQSHMLWGLLLSQTLRLETLIWGLRILNPV